MTTASSAPSAPAARPPNGQGQRGEQIMLGLACTDDRTFIATMDAINATVRNAGFAASFFGSLLLTVVCAVLTHYRRSSARWWVTAAVLLYGAAFAVTMGISVPLNNELTQAGPAAQIADPAAVRAAYEDPWVTWNLIRAVLSTAALAALVRACFTRSARQH